MVSAASFISEENIVNNPKFPLSSNVLGSTDFRKVEWYSRKAHNETTFLCYKHSSDLAAVNTKILCKCDHLYTSDFFFFLYEVAANSK